MKDYEQLYYDSLYKIRQLEKRIRDLEQDLQFVKKADKKKIDIKNEIIKQFSLYKKEAKNETKKFSKNSRSNN